MRSFPAESSDRYRTFPLLRRLLVDEALGHWPRYAAAVAMMAIVAGCTAVSAYLLGTMINAAYVNKNYREIVALGLLAMAIFVVKALATYGSAVWLSWIGNRIVADNQQRMFDKLLQEDIGFFADRHSSEFIVRLSTGAAAVSQTINLLITAVGRDLMSLIGLTIVMVSQDPIMSIAGLIIAPPALILLRTLFHIISPVLFPVSHGKAIRHDAGARFQVEKLGSELHVDLRE